MSRSSLYLKPNKLYLQILGVVAGVVTLTSLFIFVKQSRIQNGDEKTGGIDKVALVNRSPHGFEVAWSTVSEPTSPQWVEVGTKKGNYSLRFDAEALGATYIAKVTNLEPNTDYTYRIRMGDKTYLLPSLAVDGIHTPSENKEKPISPAYGKATLPSLKPYVGGLLIYEIDGYYPIAVFTKQTGEWLLPLTGLIEKKSNMISGVADSTPVLIRLFSFPAGSIRTTVGLTRPLKQSIVATKSIYLAKSSAISGESVLGTQTQGSFSKANGISSITYPKEGALIPGNTPLIRGAAPADKDVIVLIQGASKQYSYRTKANEKGDWLIQYPVVLEAGKYTIVATIQNGVGATTVVRRSFTIVKSGEQVLGVATGSPTLAPTVPVPTTVIPTYSSPTITSTISATLPSQVPTRFVPTATQPVTGGGISGYLFGSLIFIVIGTGLVLAF